MLVGFNTTVDNTINGITYRALPLLNLGELMFHDYLILIVGGISAVIIFLQILKSSIRAAVLTAGLVLVWIITFVLVRSI